MANRKDTRSSPFYGRDRLSPSQHMRLGNGFRCEGPTVEPMDEADGVPVVDWSSVHVIFYADKDASTGLFATIRAWRWYDKQRDGQSGLSGDEVGRWIFDCDTIIALDPALAGGGRGADHVWQTRGAAKMYWQVVSIAAEGDTPPDVYPWVIIQPFGYTRNDDPHTISVFDTSCGGADPNVTPSGGGGAGLASVKATHWSPADGNVSYVAAGQLACSGWPFVVDDDNCLVLAVVVLDENSVVTEYINGVDGVSISAYSNEINISTVTPFLSTDQAYWVYVVYQEKAYDDVSDSTRTQEIEPLNTKFTAPEYILNLVEVDADPGESYAPSVDGVIVDDYKDIGFQIHAVGGKGDDMEQSVNRTVTVTFQGCNELDDGSGSWVWVDLASGYSLYNDTTQDVWQSAGLVALDDLVDFDNYVQRRIRVKYDWNADPDDDPGSLIITMRRKAL